MRLESVMMGNAVVARGRDSASACFLPWAYALPVFCKRKRGSAERARACGARLINQGLLASALYMATK
jgi:hypothetical protein